MSEFDRRAFIKKLGLGMLVLGPAANLAGRAGFIQSVAPPLPLHQSSVQALLSPLVSGSRFFSGEITTISVHDYYFSLDISPRDHGFFRIEVFAKDRDPSAFRPVISTKKMDLFIANGGTGHKRTAQSHGLAAYHIAGLLARNERNINTAAMQTLRFHNSIHGKTTGGSINNSGIIYSGRIHG